MPHFVSEWSELGMGREWIQRKTQKALVYKGMKREWLVRLLEDALGNHTISSLNQRATFGQTKAFRGAAFFAKHWVPFV